MIVSELIEHLEGFDPDQQVIVMHTNGGGESYGRIDKLESDPSLADERVVVIHATTNCEL